MPGFLIFLLVGALYYLISFINLISFFQPDSSLNPLNPLNPLNVGNSNIHVIEELGIYKYFKEISSSANDVFYNNLHLKKHH